MQLDARRTKSQGCRPEKGKNNTVAIEPWPLEDRIRWVEWRIRELTVDRGEYVDKRGRWLLEEKAAGGRMLSWGDLLSDYAVWWLKVRDGLSWHQIAYRFFPAATEPEIEAFESRVRRAFKRVERNHPGSKHFKSPRLSERANLLLPEGAHGLILLPH